MGISEIAREISGCRRCGLHAGRIMPVPGEGPTDARVVFVGEAPGRDEDRVGRPFVGRAGRLLDELLGTAGLQRKDVFITNVVKCRPPGNRNPGMGEIKACMPYLRRQIDSINPEIVCLLGGIALKALLGEDRVSRLHGKIIRRDRAYLPMYHPAAALRNPKLRVEMVKDMQRLREFLSDSRKH
jgi:DNA polymerase